MFHVFCGTRGGVISIHDTKEEAERALWQHNLSPHYYGHTLSVTKRQSKRDKAAAVLIMLAEHALNAA